MAQFRVLRAVASGMPRRQGRRRFPLRILAAPFAPRVAANTSAVGLTIASAPRNIGADEAKRLVCKAMNKRMAKPAETADALAPVLSEGARVLTGKKLTVPVGGRPHL